MNVAQPSMSAWGGSKSWNPQAARMDESLIDRARQGDEAAFRELFVQYRETVARIVHRVMGPSSELEDIVQDVFVHVYRSLGSFRGESKFSTWLYRLAVNVTRMHLRRGRSRPRIADASVPEAPRSDEPGDTPEQAAERAERVRALYRLLDGLSEKKRMVLVLHDLEGVAAKDIADIVEAPILTVRTRLFYARKDLYAALAEEPSLRPIVETLMPRLPGRPDSTQDPSTDAQNAQPEGSQTEGSQTETSRADEGP